MSRMTSPQLFLPADEVARMAALRDYHILDTPPEIAFDRLTRLAARYFNMPIALISLIDQDRQWFKSRYGLSVMETPRERSFCDHAIRYDDVTVIEDVPRDRRFAGNPLLTKDPDIRFYAGAPLVSKHGHKLGAVCVIDRVPHDDFDQAKRSDLAELAAIAIDEMDLRQAARSARRDLEQLQEQQRQLERERRRAESVMQEKQDFIATISHELRTPMNGILGMAYLLNDTSLDKTQQEYIDTINHSAQNLLLLINDVLDLSKIEAGELLLEKKSFDIKTNFIQTLKLLLPLARKKGNALVSQIDPALPDFVIGDPGRFTQIVTNLVGNAVKFTENGKVEVGLEYNAENQSIYCEVIDTGIGIPPDRHAQIFEKFTQGDASITQRYGGTGLGLAITKHLVTMLGGSVGFTSQSGMGSCFWFTLPLQLRETVPPVPCARQDKTSSALTPAAAARVLIAEDHPVNILFLSSLLKKFGLNHIDVAEDGLQVMEKINAGNVYDVIFMDCKMPKQNGYETTRLIRYGEHQSKSGRRAPIIAMTANAMAGDREICFEAGMDIYMSKPMLPEKIREILSHWLSFDNAPDMDLDAAPDSPSPAPFDIRRLDLVAETAAAKIAVIDQFIALARDAFEILRQARRDREQQIWRDNLHYLKGAAANLGMTALEKICASAQSSAASYAQRSAALRAMEEEARRIERHARAVFQAGAS